MTTSPSISQHGEPDHLPDFVFPARGASLSSSAPATFSRAARPPFSGAELSNGVNERLSKGSGPMALPAFSFHSNVDADSGMASPPVSPSRANRAHFHKRGTSEFIGGDGKSGSGLGLMSTSPTQGDGVLPAPNSLSLGPAQGKKRGHAHRRSAAISAHDLSFILKPSDTNVRAGSAPCSPGGDEQDSPFKKEQPASDVALETSEQTLPPKTANRTRVGFSDELQFIPRPLSLVSSETSSTVRPGHSVSGSLSSIVSTSSPQTKERNSPTPSYRITDVRPKTAAARLTGSPSPDRPSPRRHRSNPILPDLSSPPSPLTSRSPHKKWTFFGHEEASPANRPTSSTSMFDATHASPPASPVFAAADIPLATIERTSSRRSSVSKGTGKKRQKKVKSWAGSILGRKTRPRSQKQRRSPTPPNRFYSPINETSLADSDNVVPQSGPSPPKLGALQTDFTSWRPRTVPNDETMSPMIDLDAALGPFQTPSSWGPDWDASQKESGQKRRPMHSAMNLSHRRAESAPEFEMGSRFGIRSLASTSLLMPDVFEEEEDDDWEDSKGQSDKSSSKTEEEEESNSGIDIKVVDAENLNEHKLMDWSVDPEDPTQRGVKRKGSGLSDGERRHLSASAQSTHSSASLQDEVILEESTSPVEVVDDSMQRPVSRAQSSDSTATPPLRPHPAKDLAPVDIQPLSLQPPYLTPTTPQSASPFPSPRSPFSYDTQRISTAPSSLADEGGFQSLLLGEPGPELRMSVDDVPSLTDRSAESTMTKESGKFWTGMNHQFREGQRSASLSSAAVTRKRSSMASLSRLISSSHGEKSKLSIESRAPHLEPDKKDKGSKTKRISRMMQFWKPKDTI